MMELDEFVAQGWNLRGLIIGYLEMKGWTWTAAEETWTAPSGGSYYGEYATQNAMWFQIESEEGRIAQAV